ncbi:MAG: bifunctional methylenetetrahydrofolate dehydrogenase/methenyltetrahydrofolate cyclohydrolase FolD [Clostridia bacterium]|nr:bifunctional methylenetetrahydrofolate dehydrogenase/methenyltetrahydrofolate cyclohydrolase FolD [Clostridia bacterium]
MATILDGKALAAKLKEEIKKQVSALQSEGVYPKLAVILVGDDPASQVYVRNKKRDCEEVGIVSQSITLSADTGREELAGIIRSLNNDASVHGILVQLPLPEGLDDSEITQLIAPEKDVDAFSYYNVGRIMTGDYSFVPCTPAGCMELIKLSGISVEGKNCVVIGRSNIVGKPMAMLLMQANGTVTVCHSRTKNLAEITRGADVLVCAVGKPGFVTGDMVKEGAVVIDVGINRCADGKLRGDCEFDSCAAKASCITPVPGGVGPMTRVMLLKNTINAASIQGGKENA